MMWELEGGKQDFISNTKRVTYKEDSFFLAFVWDHTP